eukprot:754042-Hanusia_phi.AAC.4
MEAAHLPGGESATEEGHKKEEEEEGPGQAQGELHRMAERARDGASHAGSIRREESPGGGVAAAGGEAGAGAREEKDQALVAMARREKELSPSVPVRSHRGEGTSGSRVRQGEQSLRSMAAKQQQISSILTAAPGGSSAEAGAGAEAAGTTRAGAKGIAAAAAAVAAGRGARAERETGEGAGEGEGAGAGAGAGAASAAAAGEHMRARAAAIAGGGERGTETQPGRRASEERRSRSE